MNCDLCGREVLQEHKEFDELTTCEKCGSRCCLCCIVLGNVILCDNCDKSESEQFWREV